jgi:hypothetical protein
VKVFGGDEYGNYLLIEEVVNVLEPATILPIEVELLSKISANYARGDGMMVVAKAYYANENISGARLELVLENNERVELHELQAGQYSSLYTIPFDSNTGISDFRVVATYFDQNTAYRGEMIFSANVRPAELDMQVRKPDHMSFMVGEKIDLVVELSYPNGSLVPNAEVKALLRGKEIVLEQATKGVYVAEYFPLEGDMGEAKLFFGAEDAHQNAGYASVTLDISGKGGEYYLSRYGFVIGLVIVAAIGLAAVVAYGQLHVKKVSALRQKETDIINKIKDLQNQYFVERTVGEKNYRELLNKYEMELSVVRQSIELSGRKGVGK